MTATSMGRIALLWAFVAFGMGVASVIEGEAEPSLIAAAVVCSTIWAAAAQIRGRL